MNRLNVGYASANVAQCIVDGGKQLLQELKE